MWPSLEDTIVEQRKEIKDLTTRVKNAADYIKKWEEDGNGKDKGEMIANATLAMRHLEDAAMRLGKVMQAMNGGVSVYDK